jgi:predicted RNA-binding Zn ribbon-like protein
VSIALAANEVARHMMKTMVFEEQYDVSIDDFEDTAAIDRFIESKTGRSLEVNDRRTTFTLRGGNVFRASNRSRESVDASISKSFDAMKAQRKRLLQDE